MMSVTSPDGATVWNSCYTTSGPGACAMYLELIPIKPLVTWTRSIAWEPDATGSHAALPQGIYAFTASFEEVGWSQTVRFKL